MARLIVGSLLLFLLGVVVGVCVTIWVVGVTTGKQIEARARGILEEAFRSAGPTESVKDAVERILREAEDYYEHGQGL